MRDKSGISQEASGSLALVRRLVRDFMRRHAGAIALAFVCMGLAAGSTALRAWLMEPVLDHIFIAREASLLALLGGVALVLALVKGMADYGQTVLMNRVGQRVIVDVQTACG
jgi:subfamily B ATP-binding cassette protein MsbA